MWVSMIGIDRFSARAPKTEPAAPARKLLRFIFTSPRLCGRRILMTRLAVEKIVSHWPGVPPGTIDQMTVTEEKHQSTPVFRAYAVVALFIALRAVGNLSLTWGMKHFPQMMSVDPLPYLRAMLDPFVAL